MAGPLQGYTGTYRTDRLGDVVVTLEGDQLRARWGLAESLLRPLRPDEFTAS